MIFKMKYVMLAFMPVLFSASCSKTDSAKKESPAAMKTDSVKTFILKTDKIEKQISLPGELLPNERVEIRPKLIGYVRQLKVDIGSVVRKGQVIVTIDAPEVHSRLGEGTGKVNAAKARYQSSLDTYSRILQASKTKGVVSASELEKARGQMQADSADYEAQRFIYDSYKQVGDYLAITAPFDGTITQRNVNEGAYVGASNEKPIVVIEDNRKLRLRVAVPEALTGVDLKADNVTFTTKANPTRKFEATLARKSGSIDVNTRSEIWEFEVNNKDRELKPGSFATVSLVITRETPTFIVPFSAVVTTLERKFVIRLNRDSSRWVDVSQGINLADRVEIFGPLQAGDTIVLRANEEIRASERMFAKF
jgi:membrane fusion protein (multidrug efflux system)